MVDYFRNHWTVSSEYATPEGEILPELQGPVSVLIQGLIEFLLVPLLLMAVAWLQKYGLDVDVDQIAVMIEAEVKQIFNRDPDGLLSPEIGMTG